MFMRVFETPVDMYGRLFVLAHDDAGVGAADEVAARKLTVGLGLQHFSSPVDKLSNYIKSTLL
jgi:hypothetical protein